jgi:hypothetical protein
VNTTSTIVKPHLLVISGSIRLMIGTANAYKVATNRL